MNMQMSTRALEFHADEEPRTYGIAPPGAIGVYGLFTIGINITDILSANFYIQCEPWH